MLACLQLLRSLLCPLPSKPVAQAEAHGWYYYHDEKTADYDLRDRTRSRLPIVYSKPVPRVADVVLSPR
jgi:hypothetical protein